MNVDYITHMGSDLTVVNAARVSFNKQSQWNTEEYQEEYDFESRTVTHIPVLQLKESDKKLINFLARENHWTPFGHCFVQFRIKAPIFVARQLAKHQIGLTWNEISRRYVDSEPEFYFPEKWRKKNPDKKQGSYEDEFVDLQFAEECSVKSVIEICKQMYNAMIDQQVCAEQARMILPQNMYTEWYWSGSLYAFARICKLRCKKDTQKETRDVADKISNIISPLFPESWKNLLNHHPTEDK
jgi:thymidylate synthase (FAD)